MRSSSARIITPEVLASRKRRDEIADEIIRWHLDPEKRNLRIHDLFPDLPPAPFYCNLRLHENDPKNGGWLSRHLANLIALEVRETIEAQKIPCKWIFGIPNAGTGFAKLIAEAKEPFWHHVTLAKSDPPVIELPEICFEEPGIGFDDVIGPSCTKFKWFAPMMGLGVQLKALFVVVDRDEGGIDFLKQAFNLPTLFLFKLQWLLRRGMKKNSIDAWKLREQADFSNNVKTRLKSTRKVLGELEEMGLL